MCRLCLVLNNPRSAKIKDVLIKHFLELEEAQGGDGNGLYLPTRKALVKSLDLEELLSRKILFPCLFHTRLASAGAVNKKNCHPFQYQGIIWAHNGVAYKYVKPEVNTDSYNLVRHSIKDKISITDLEWFGNIIVTSTDTKYPLVFLYCRKHLVRCTMIDGTEVITSQLTKSLKPFVKTANKIQNAVYLSEFSELPCKENKPKIIGKSWKVPPYVTAPKLKKPIKLYNQTLSSSNYIPAKYRIGNKNSKLDKYTNSKGKKRKKVQKI